MLRNVPPILSPDLLWTLRAMGHGDEIVIADANFPGESCGEAALPPVTNILSIIMKLKVSRNFFFMLDSSLWNR